MGQESWKGTEVDSGTSSPTPWACYDPGSSCLRTWQQSLGGDLDLMSSSVILPASGSMRNGYVFEQPTSAPVTDAPGSSSSPVLLRTPTAQLAVNGGSQHPDKRKAGGHGPTLADEVEHLLPQSRPMPAALGATPRASDGKHGGPNMRGSSGDLMLPSAVMLLPTPTAMDSRGARNATANRKSVGPATNNDGWTLCDVFWTGESTNSPSADGNASSAIMPPGQLSLFGPETD